MTIHSPISKATDSPLPSGEGLGRRVDLRSRVETVRSNLTKRQIDVTMFACGVEKLEGLALSLIEG